MCLSSLIPGSSLVNFKDKLPLFFSFGIPPANNPSGLAIEGEDLFGGLIAEGDNLAAVRTVEELPGFATIKKYIYFLL